MSKKLISLALAMAFVVSTASVSLAATCRGTVTKVEGTSVTVECKDGSMVTVEGSAEVGQKVKVKNGKLVVKKKKAIEGC